MGLFSSKGDKEAKKAEKERKKESHAIFVGKTLQPIGKIPAGQTVYISLVPEGQVLNIHYDKTDITLPYNRMISFILESESKIIQGGNSGLHALTGGVLFGATGAIVGAASAKNKESKRWIGILTYKDKEGSVKSLSFLHPYVGDTKHYGAAQFEKTVNDICSRMGEEIKEL